MKVGIAALFIRLKSKKIITIYDITPYIVPESFTSITLLRYKLLFSRTLKTADKIIAISNSTKKDLINYFNIPKEKIKVILLATDEKPLIDVGGLPELVKDKNFVVEPNNLRALAEKLLLALDDDELLKKLSEDSRDLAEEYSWDKIAEKTVELYGCVLDGEGELCQ